MDFFSFFSCNSDVRHIPIPNLIAIYLFYSFVLFKFNSFNGEKQEKKNGKSETFSVVDMQQKNMMKTIVLASDFGCFHGSSSLVTAIQDASPLQMCLLFIHFLTSFICLIQKG